MRGNYESLSQNIILRVNQKEGKKNQSVAGRRVIIIMEAQGHHYIGI